MVCCFSKEDKTTLANLLKEGEWSEELDSKYGISQRLFNLYCDNKVEDFQEERLLVNKSIEEEFINKIFKNSGITIEGFTTSSQEDNIDKRIYALLKWLCEETDWYITHPFDIDRLQEVANMIADLNLPFKIEQIEICCRELHWPEQTVKQIVDVIQEAKIKRFNTLRRINKEYLYEIVSNL